MFLHGNSRLLELHSLHGRRRNKTRINKNSSKIIKQHALLIAERIQNLGGTTVDDVGMMGHVAEFMKQDKRAN